VSAVALPNKLSDLLELAVRDVQKCEADKKRFALHMGNWHRPDAGKGVCVVCMAGAVMAQTVGVPDDEQRDVFQGLACAPDIEPHRAAFNAVNELRISKVQSAATELGIVLSPDQIRAAEAAEDMIRSGLPESEYGYCGEDVEDWDNVNNADFHAPWETYLQAVTVLREAGL